VDEMTPNQRILAAFKGEPVDRPPWCPFLAYVWGSFPPEVQKMSMLEFNRAVGADPMWRGDCCPVSEHRPQQLTVAEHTDSRGTTRIFNTPVGQLKERWQISEIGSTQFIVEHPLKTADDFKVMCWIEENTRFSYDSDSVAKYVAETVGVTVAMLLPRMKSAFQAMIEQYVGTEELIYALADFPDTVETLWRQMVENDLTAVRLAAEADFEHWITWEDSSTGNYSPAMYERYIGSEIRQWCEILKTHGGKKYHQHACGLLKGILPAMLAQGIAGVESLSPPPTGDITLADARQLVGPDICITGGIEPTQFLNLSMAELGPYVEKVIADGSPGAFVLANSDSCPPGVTFEKFKLVGDVVRACGR